ncbi:pentapeptide repeat-containing protein [Pseudomonas protegens]|uniref:pentapeptide repeat-containing protein n=1 Tax=Pseudomonas protegens TaxID=380021 RepID=UPI000E1E42B2|nr:pentapeptide repeat-containing protein [Pseudomonas protegens]AXK56481.1 pentapeptide repeat-containing protein [Pseudomonas protegens]
MDDKQKVPEPGVRELQDRWKTAEGQRVRRELISAWGAGNDYWPELLYDLPSVSHPLSPDDLDDLRGINLSKQILERFSLACCDLSYSDLQHCNLKKTILQRSRLNWANLTRSVLVATDLLNIEALYANFSDCRIRKAMAMSSDFRHSTFLRTEINACVLNGSDFTGSDLKLSAFEGNELHNVIFPDGFKLSHHLAHHRLDHDLGM